MSAIIQKLEKHFLPDIQLLTENFRLTFPELNFNIYQVTLGSNTPGYNFGIECTFPDKPPTESDSIALSIHTCHLTTQPKIMVDVCWGDGCIEESFPTDWLSSDNWPEITDEVLQQISDNMPQLMQAFERAIKRVNPINLQ